MQEQETHKGQPAKRGILNKVNGCVAAVGASAIMLVPTIGCDDNRTPRAPQKNTISCASTAQAQMLSSMRQSDSERRLREIQQSRSR